MMISFKVFGDIKTKQRPRATIIGGHARAYTPKDTVYYENYVRNCYKTATDDYFFGEKPIIAKIVAYYKAPENIRKLDGYERLSCCCHQDLDNLAKIILDSLNGIAYVDDKQVIQLTCSKQYTTGDRECVVVELEEDTNYISLDELKKINQYNKDMDRYQVLCHKNKLSKTELERLKQLKNKLFKEIL